MSRPLVLTMLVGGMALQALPADAQARSSYAGAFERTFPAAADLLYGLDEEHEEMLEALYRNPNAQALETSMMASFRNEMLDGADRAVPAAEAMPSLARFDARLAEIFDRTHALRRELYDIYADPQVTDKYAAAEAATDRYLAQANVALPATPKSFMIMHEQPYSMTFQMGAPQTNGLMWAGHWLQFAVFDPMIYYDDAGGRRTGMDRVVERYRELLATPPESTPKEMPTPAAISPELTRTHPRAAAIFDNLNMLHDLVADILANGDVANKQMALNDAVGLVTSGESIVSHYDWLVGSLRHGIFNQGGPAIGRLDRPERNMPGGHGEHGGGQMVMPGMPGGSTGGGPAMPPSSPDPMPDDGTDHSQH